MENPCCMWTISTYLTFLYVSCPLSKLKWDHCFADFLNISLALLKSLETSRRSYNCIQFCLAVQNHVHQSLSIHLAGYQPFSYPSIHWNPWGGFYVRPGPQASAGRQSSSKQCLLSWRRLGLTSHAGCSSLPYVTVKSQWPRLQNQAECVRGRTEKREVGVNEKRRKTCINPYWSDSEQGTVAQRGR